MIENQLQETLKMLRAKAPGFTPQVGVVLGSGLSGFAKQVQAIAEIPYEQIPHFAVATVEGHPGRLTLGHIGDVAVAVMQGRLHAYEGKTFAQVVYPVRVMAELGVKQLVVTNAAGGLRKTMKPGDFVVLRDHLNLTGDNPLRGPNWSRGPRFVDMTEPYDKALRTRLKRCLLRAKARVHEGVYVGVLGPTFETAAEIQFFARIGGHAVGMSTVAEVMAARHASLSVVGLSCITNLGTGLSRTKLSHDDVKAVAQKVEPKFVRALTEFVAGC